MKNQFKSIFLLAVFILCSCYSEENLSAIFPKEEMPFTENTTFTESGRFFVAAGFFLYEILKNGQVYDRVVVAQGSISLEETGDVPCFFSGLTSDGDILYAGCTAPEPDNPNLPLAASIYRIDSTKADDDPVKIQSAILEGHQAILPNGMTVHKNGDLYVSNSFGTNPGEAPILRIVETSAVPFTFTQETFLAADTGSWPNGIQIHNNDLYFASGNELKKIKINPDGSAGEIMLVYEADPSIFMDDFAVLPGTIALAEIDDPRTEPTTARSQLVFLSIQKQSLGNVLDIVEFHSGIAPSSVNISTGRLFKFGSLILTDYVFGGLYELGID